MSLTLLGSTPTSLNIGWDDSPSFNGYVLSVNGGEPVDVGKVSSYNLTGLSSNASYSISVKGYVNSHTGIDKRNINDAFASDYYYSEPPANAFDGNPNTFWTTNGPVTGILNALMPEATTIKAYSITHRNDSHVSRNPKMWSLKGSNDGTNYVDIDARVGVIWQPGETKLFLVNLPGSYAVYRWVISENSGASQYLSVADISLFGDYITTRNVNEGSAQTENFFTEPPMTPENLRIDIRGWDQAKVVWDPPSEGDAPEYYEYRFNGGTPTAVESTETWLLLLDPETSYSIDVRSFGYSETSPWVSLTFETAKVPVPENLRVSDIEWDRVTLNWDIPETHIQINFFDVRVNGDNPEAIGIVESFEVSGLNRLTTYLFEIRSQTEYGITPWVSVSAKTSAKPSERLVWSNVNPKTSQGVDRGVLYPSNGRGVAWNGLTNVSSQSLGGELDPVYLDGVKTQSLQSSKNFQGTISAYSAPDEFAPCEGLVALRPGFLVTHQPRERFGFSYRTLIGENHYKIHLVYNATANPGDKSYVTISESPVPSIFTWTIETVPVQVPGIAPTAHFVIDSSKIDPERLEAIESLLYGTETRPAYLPSMMQIVSMVNNWNPRLIIPDYDNGLFGLVEGTGDLIEGDVPGLYLTLPDARLVVSSVDGLYNLME